jgi:hypothetical protein
MTILNTPASFSGHPGEPRSAATVGPDASGWSRLRTVRMCREMRSIRHLATTEGRTLGSDFEACLYYNINVNEDRDAALAESKRFLDAYYGVDYDQRNVRGLGGSRLAG